ncbi:hypothetical protein B0H21DRAFT_837237 [Amylocystis lapponica]|nr:hypothetical protein B0H21DRAFT_837237 [Amylocystis lapponica]
MEESAFEHTKKMKKMQKEREQREEEHQHKMHMMRLRADRQKELAVKRAEKAYRNKCRDPEDIQENARAARAQKQKEKWDVWYEDLKTEMPSVAKPRVKKPSAYNVLSGGNIETNSVMGDLDFDFSKCPSGSRLHCSDLVTCLRPDGVEHDYDRRLRMHPIALRSFATFPPVCKVVLLDLFNIRLPNSFRSSGITVFDVQNALHHELFEDLTNKAICSFMGWPEEPHWKVLQEASRKYRTLYKIFSAVRLLGLDVEECYAQKISLRMQCREGFRALRVPSLGPPGA